MKLDGGISSNLTTAASSAKALEDAGYSGGWTAETAHDPFFPLLLAAEHTSQLEIGTSIAVAFARNPMTLANIGWTYSHSPKVDSSWDLAAKLSRTSPSDSAWNGATPPRACAK